MKITPLRDVAEASGIAPALDDPGHGFLLEYGDGCSRRHLVLADDPAEAARQILKASDGKSPQLNVALVTESRELLELGPSSAAELRDALMAIVSDETPEDAPNTDEHPLEVLRMILDEVDQLCPDAGDPGPC